MNLCQIADCQKPRWARGLCPMHLRRLRVHGDPHKTMRQGPRKTKYRQTVQDGVNKSTHVVVVEKILGKRLPKGAEVHHWNEDRSDNRPSNLVVCPSHQYHALLHARARAYDACGHADWRRCNYCKQYDLPENLYLHKTAHAAHHRSCHVAYVRARKSQ